MCNWKKALNRSLCWVDQNTRDHTSCSNGSGNNDCGSDSSGVGGGGGDRNKKAADAANAVVLARAVNVSLERKLEDEENGNLLNSLLMLTMGLVIGAAAATAILTHNARK